MSTNIITVDYDPASDSLLIKRPFIVATASQIPPTPIPPKPLPFDIAMARRVFEGDILKDFDTDGNPTPIIKSFIELCFGKATNTSVKQMLAAFSSAINQYSAAAIEFDIP
jgi:hypothetical protein